MKVNVQSVKDLNATSRRTDRPEFETGDALADAMRKDAYDDAA
jgi:hypothetical protein